MRNVEEILSAIEIMTLAVGIAVTVIVGALGAEHITPQGDPVMTSNEMM